MGDAATTIARPGSSLSVSLPRSGAPFDRGQIDKPERNASHMNATAKTTRTLARSAAAATIATAIAAGVLLVGAGSAQASGTLTTVERYRVTLARCSPMGCRI